MNNRGGIGDMTGALETHDQKTSVRESPFSRTIEATGAHYGWTRTFIYNQLSAGTLDGRKAGRRLLIITESAEMLFASLPRGRFASPKPNGGADILAFSVAARDMADKIDSGELPPAAVATALRLFAARIEGAATDATA